MSENYTLVQQGFRILLQSLSGYIGREMSHHFGTDWWSEALQVLDDQRDLPISGEYGELVDSLDIANCLRLIKREWYSVFGNNLSRNCLNWVNELMGIRNEVSHIGQQDLEQPKAERYLNTMVLLCREIDPESAEEIRKIYQKVRARAADFAQSSPVYMGVKRKRLTRPRT